MAIENTVFIDFFIRVRVFDCRLSRVDMDGDEGSNNLLYCVSSPTR